MEGTLITSKKHSKIKSPQDDSNNKNVQYFSCVSYLKRDLDGIVVLETAIQLVTMLLGARLAKTAAGSFWPSFERQGRQPLQEIPDQPRSPIRHVFNAESRSDESKLLDMMRGAGWGFAFTAVRKGSKSQLDDFVFSVGYRPRSRRATPGQTHIVTDAQLDMHVSVASAVKVRSSIVSIVQQFFEASARLECYYGHGEIAGIEETGAFAYYDGTREGFAYPLCRLINRESWDRLSAKNRAHRVRDVYWANLFGPEMTRLIASKSKVFDQCEHLDIDGVSKICLSNIIRFANDSTLVLLGDDPLAAARNAGRYPPIADALRGAWLRRELMRMDLLV